VVEEAFTGVVVAVGQTPSVGVDAGTAQAVSVVGTDEVVVQVHVGVAIELVVQSSSSAHGTVSVTGSVIAQPSEQVVVMVFMGIVGVGVSAQSQ
jgi:hypothetical protein